MLELLQRSPIAFIIAALALVMALVFNQFAQAWAADRFGDPTPRSQGRVTLNPIKHLDPLGTLLLIFAGFGFAKPVAIDTRRLGRWENLWVAAAGPLSNILLVVLALASLRLLPPSVVGEPKNLSLVGHIITLFLSINVVLAVFNLLPIPMLSGSRIIGGLVPSLGRALDDFERSSYAFLGVMAFILVFREQIGQWVQAISQWVLSIAF